MRKALSVEEIERVIETLTPTEQLRVIEKVVRALRRTRVPADKERDWTELYGAGRGLWEGEDAQNYVTRLREDRL